MLFRKYSWSGPGAWAGAREAAISGMSICFLWRIKLLFFCGLQRGSNLGGGDWGSFWQSPPPENEGAWKGQPAGRRIFFGYVSSFFTRL
ncbi:hypothetical protein SBA4_3130006 [Candidatus Sulfopaludibacter sp. SbA4]|nr:hypothetical protein SBA4_3130006 [Candidatus Sulfopaludibacter sp. SbA4]